MRKPFKKFLIIFIIIVSVLIVGYAVYIIEFLITTEVGMYYRFNNDILLDNLEAYTLVAQLIYNDFQNCDCRTHGYSLTNNKEIYEKYRATCERSWKIILISNEEHEFYQTVTNTIRLAKNRLEDIQVFENFVVFRTANGIASLIYSVDSLKPNFVNAPTEEGRVIVRKIADNWYYSHKR
ncbi:MAG: hypothetical protein LBD23_11775 [Oscillospiraceae bacterium]|nr:hypothetical protein [Oscillospiraceae bacterium]